MSRRGRLANWWRAEPWRVGRTGWRYRALYRSLRRGSWNPQAGRWLPGGEPRGRLASLWGAITFPHVHDDEHFEPDWTVPPGDTLLELMAERDMTPEELARIFGVDVGNIHMLLTGAALITDAAAHDLEQVFGVSAGFWMELERRHREWIARHHPGMTVDLRLSRDDDRYGLATLAEESGTDVTSCEFCGGPLDADHPWRRGRDGAAAHEACIGMEDTG